MHARVHTQALEESIARELEAEADGLRTDSDDGDADTRVAGQKGERGGGGGEADLPPRLRDVPKEFRKTKGIWGLLTSGQVCATLNPKP